MFNQDVNFVAITSLTM